jgi:hypothetical protein
MAPKFLIETDVLAEFLTAAPAVRERSSLQGPTLLRQALGVSICYTTMLNVMELFRAAAHEPERNAVAAMLHVVRVLGFHPRYAISFAELAQETERHSHIRITDRETMILGMARTSKLTILTKLYFDRYRSLGADVIATV